jgi:hypothetical protein
MRRNYTYSSLLLRRDLTHAQPPSKTSEHFLARLEFCTGVIHGIDNRAKVAFVRDRSSKSPSHKFLVKEWESGLLAPIGDDAIVTAQIPLSQSADVKIQFTQEALRAMTVVSRSMTGIASEKLVCAQSGE